MPKAFILLLNRTILSQAHLSLESSSTRAQKKPKEFTSGFAFAIKSLKFNPISVHSDRNFQPAARLDSPNFNALPDGKLTPISSSDKSRQKKFIHSLQKVFTICAWIVHGPFMIPSRISHESVMNRSLNVPIFLPASLTRFLTFFQIHSWFFRSIPSGRSFWHAKKNQTVLPGSDFQFSFIQYCLYSAFSAFGAGLSEG